jgi:ubiquinone/menaquinone biosynthesis C-methylase UbiE
MRFVKMDLNLFLKEGIQESELKIEDGIYISLNPVHLTGDNQKYQKMYDWMSYGYDFVETVIGKIKYGNSINQVRKDIISKLEWKDSVSVLYVSIGTGKDLDFIPIEINKYSLNIVGADISIGMLNKCKSKFKHSKLNLSLFNSCAEDLPFRDNVFDIVFHVGGINFFNDKKKAIQEMIRVAKPKTKILIADETSDYMQQEYQKSIFSKKYFENQSIDLKEIESLIPKNVQDQKTELLWENKFYCISFRK